MATGGRSHPNAKQMASQTTVLDAAVEAFLERGYAGTSIDDIADRLGATKGLVYHYFRTKADIYLAAHKHAMALAFEAIEPTLTEGQAPRAKLYAMAHAHARMMMNEHGYMRLAVHHTEMSLVAEARTRMERVEEVVRLRRTYESLFENVIIEGIETGDFQAGPPRTLARAALGTLNWMGVWFTRPGRSSTVDETAHVIARFVTSGVVGEPGLERELSA